VVGARQKDLLILEGEMRALCDELTVTTDDGSYGMHGRSRRAAALVERHEHIDRVIAVDRRHDAR
jgi:ferredoxin--NADP+ reductase